MWIAGFQADPGIGENARVEEADLNAAPRCHVALIHCRQLGELPVTRRPFHFFDSICIVAITNLCSRHRRRRGQRYARGSLG